MVLVGCTPPGRHVEQHDYFFGVGNSIESLFPNIKKFWPEGKVHIDAWKEINTVEGHQVTIAPKCEETSADKKLFFINLGGYQPGRFEEQHYIILTVKKNIAEASKEAKSTLFYQDNQFDNAVSHIDDKYGIDLDDLYQVEDILSPEQKEMYCLKLIPAADLPEDPMHLGYLKLPAKYHNED